MSARTADAELNLRQSVIKQQCLTLRLSTLASHSGLLAEQAERERQPDLSYLEALLAAELEERERRAIDHRIKDAHLPRCWVWPLIYHRRVCPSPSTAKLKVSSKPTTRVSESLSGASRPALRQATTATSTTTSSYRSLPDACSFGRPPASTGRTRRWTSLLPTVWYRARGHQRQRV